MFEKTPAPAAAEDAGEVETAVVTDTVVVGGGGGPSEDAAVVPVPAGTVVTAAVVAATLVWAASEPAGVTVETTIGVWAGVEPG